MKLAAYAVALLLAAPAWAAPPQVDPISVLGHRQPVKPLMDEHGKPIRSLKNSITTQNWSGYAVAKFETGFNYSSALGTWQVPPVVWGQINGSATQEINSIWVGIGGFCLDAGCGSVDQTTLIQLGTMQSVTSAGVVGNYVWYELYPATAQAIPHSVNVGDIITASINCTANCVPGQTQTWQLSMTDATMGWNWTQTFNTQSAMLSAEWIVEAPGLPTQPLNNYTQTNFNPVVANGINPALTLDVNGLVAQNPYGQTSNPSSPVNGDWFGTCWGYQTLTPCAAQNFTSPPPPPLAPPTGLMGTVVVKVSKGKHPTTTYSVRLNWQQSQGATSNRVYRSVNGGAYSALTTIPANTTYTDSPVTHGATYGYEVSAINSSGTESATSTPVTVQP